MACRAFSKNAALSRLSLQHLVGYHWTLTFPTTPSEATSVVYTLTVSISLFLYLFIGAGFYYTSLDSLKLAMRSRLPSNSERSVCPGLLDAGVKDMGDHGCLFSTSRGWRLKECKLLLIFTQWCYPLKTETGRSKIKASKLWMMAGACNSMSERPKQKHCHEFGDRWTIQLMSFRTA